MTKTTEKPKVGSGAKRVAHALSKAYGDMALSTSNVVKHVCKVATDLYGGDYLPSQDVEFVVNQVAKERGWTTASAQARKSEMRTILATYDQLPAACSAFLKQVGTLTWHNAVRLGRELISADLNISKAVRNAVNKTPEPKSQAEQMKQACRRIARLSPGGKMGTFRLEFVTLCGKHNIKLGLRV